MGTKAYSAGSSASPSNGHAKQKHSTALVAANSAAPLLKVEQARQFLAQSKSFDEVRDVVDKAKAVALYLRQTSASIESQNDAAEIELRAKRRLGELDEWIPKQHGGHAAKARSKNQTEVNAPPTLENQGIDKRDLSEWRKIAAIPEDEFEEFIADRRADGARITASSVRDHSKKQKQAKQRTDKEAEAKNLPERAVVHLKDEQKFLRSFEDGSVDLLLTDPPYSTDVKDFETFSLWIGQALQKLKPTGRAYVCVGAYPIELLTYLSNLRAFGWIDRCQVLVWTYRNTLGPSPKDDYKLNWQAILYLRGVDAPPLDCPIMLEQFSVQDINAPDGRLGDRYHAWQKPDELAERLVRHATKPGDLVVDPFACTGTFLLAAARLGRKAVGCDISKENLEIAVQRGCVLNA